MWKTLRSDKTTGIPRSAYVLDWVVPVPVAFAPLETRDHWEGEEERRRWRLNELQILFGAVYDRTCYFHCRHPGRIFCSSCSNIARLSLWNDSCNADVESGREFTCFSIAMIFNTRLIDVVSGGGWADLSNDVPLANTFCFASYSILPPQVNDMPNQLVFRRIFLWLTQGRVIGVHRLLITAHRTEHLLEEGDVSETTVHADRSLDIADIGQCVAGSSDLGRIQNVVQRWKHLDTVDEHCSHTIPMDTSNIHTPGETTIWIDGHWLKITYSILVEFIPFKLREH